MGRRRIFDSRSAGWKGVVEGAILGAIGEREVEEVEEWKGLVVVREGKVRDVC